MRRRPAPLDDAEMPASLRHFDEARWVDAVELDALEIHPRPSWWGATEVAHRRWELARYRWGAEHGLDALDLIRRDRAQRRAVAHLDRRGVE